MNNDIDQFLLRHGIELAIERVEENPLGPPHWQAHFVHYALWITSTASWRGVPLYASYDRRYLEPGPSYYGEASNPTPQGLLRGMANTLHAHAQGPMVFAQRQHLDSDPAGAQFYYDAITRKLADLRILLGDEGLLELIEIGAPK